MAETLDERFASLERSSRILSSDVTALTEALSVVNAIQRDQQVLAERTAQTTERVSRVQREARYTRTTLRYLAIGSAIVLPIVALVVYVALLSHVGQLLNRQASDLRRSCELRNEQVTVQIAREQTLARFDRNGPESVAAHLDSVKALQRLLVDCTKTFSTVVTPGG